MKIAILVHHGLGDLLLALPLLRSCAIATGAAGSLVIVVKSQAEADLIPFLALDTPTETVILGKTNGRSALAALRSLIAIRRTRPDILLAPHNTSGIGAGLFAFASGARLRVGPFSRAIGRFLYSHTVSRKPTDNKAHYYLRFAYTAGLPKLPSPVQPKNLAHLLKAQPRSMPRKSRAPFYRIGLAPGSNSVEIHKRWPTEMWRGLAKMIQLRLPQSRIVIIGSPSETGLLEAVPPPNCPENWMIKTCDSVPEVLVEYANLDCVVSCCTGAVHLAAAAGTPSLAVYGPTDPDWTGSPSPQAIAVRTDLPCAPCYSDDFRTGCEAPTCMQSIAPERVLQALEEIVHQSSKESQ